MKTFKYLLFAFIATFLLTACEDDPTRAPGEAEADNSYGVYFPSQAKTGDQELDPAQAKELTFTARRTNSEGAITVPVEVSGTDNIFTTSALEFADGQEETTFKVLFDAADIGVTYSCKVQVTDPQYIAVYGERATGFDFTATRVKWNDVDADKTITYENKPFVGYEWYTDDIITTFFTVGNATYPVKVQVRDDSIDDTYPNGPNGLAGIYRMLDPYGALYPFNEPGDYVEGITIVVNAKDPEKVFIDKQSMGVDWNYGNMSIWSVGSANKDKFGTIDAGAITFPKDALMLSMANYNGGGFYVANSSGAFRLVVCQDQVVDYTLSLSAKEPSNGSVKITATLGTDVAKVKYAFFEGSLNASIAAGNSAVMDAGDIVTQEIAATGTITAKLEKTGMYTIVANVYNAAGELQDFRYLPFGYAKDNADVPVALTIGTIVSDKHKPQGATADNSVELYAYGKGISQAKWYITRSSNFEGMPAEYWAADMARTLGTDLTAEQIAAINDKGYSGVIEGLNAGTDYIMVVWAYNDYISEAFVSEFKTQGDYHALLSYGWNSVDVGWINPKDKLLKTWNLWAVDQMKETPTGREKVGELTFTENVNPGPNGLDLINVSGLSLGESASDVIQVAFYQNFVLLLKGQQVYEKDGKKIGYYIIDTAGKAYYEYDGLMVGGLVDPGYMAFITNDGDVNFNGIALRAFSDEVYGTPAEWVAMLSDLMLEDPNSAVPMPKASSPKMAQMQKLAADLKTPTNCVELRGLARACALIDEIAAGKTKPRTAATSIRRVEMPAMNAVKLSTTFSRGVDATQPVSKVLKTRSAVAVK